ILEAAAKEMGAHGYSGASLNRILEQAGLSKGAAYYYFDNKDDLLATMFVYLWQRLLLEAKLDLSELTAQDYWSSLFGLTERFMSSVKDEPWLLAAVKAIWSLPQGSRTQGPLAEVFSTVAGWLADILRRGRELGLVRRDLPEGLLLGLILALDEAADRWMSEHWDEFDAAELQRISATLFEMWTRMLAPRPEVAS
ncbi:MAG: TetR/AcrR family transcriptional regulator, partial [Myxococcota bacterium]|nr:TetR/AcrR family transcriptional regulator [Myxococcota bacterium]